MQLGKLIEGGREILESLAALFQSVILAILLFIFLNFRNFQLFLKTQKHCITPFPLLHSHSHTSMHPDKYFLFIEKAVAHSAVRCRLPFTPTDRHITILTAVRRLHSSTAIQIERYLQSCGNNITEATVLNGLKHLTKHDLLIKTGYSYCLSPLGYDYLYRVKQYLLHKRLK